jgi:hypothetical protein
VYQLNIQPMPLIRRSHLIVRSPVAAAAARIWSITDAGERPAHRPCRMIAADCRVKAGKMSVWVNPDPETRCGLRLGRRGGAVVIRCPGPAVGALSGLTAFLFAVVCEGPASLGMPGR